MKTTWQQNEDHLLKKWRWCHQKYEDEFFKKMKMTLPNIDKLNFELSMDNVFPSISELPWLIWNVFCYSMLSSFSPLQNHYFLPLLQRTYTYWCFFTSQSGVVLLKGNNSNSMGWWLLWSLMTACQTLHCL